MILEVATLNIKEGLSEAFETNFQKAEKIIASMKGYLSHQLKKCIEQNFEHNCLQVVLIKMH